MHRAIKLRHIRAFLDISVDGSLSSVARKQGLSQPALSRTLSELEDLLGTPLFRREQRRLILTEQGLSFRHHASLAIQALEAGAAALRPGAGRATVRVGILPTAATRLFPRIALRFQAAEPATLLKIETGPHPYLLGLLRQGNIDLMVGRMPIAGDMAGLQFAHLYEEEIVLVARHDHPHADQPVVRLLQSVPLVLPTEGAVIRGAVNDFLASLGLTDLQPAMETVALAVGRGILTGSDAVWFISRGVVAEELDRKEMIVIPTGVRFLSGSVGITRRLSDPLSLSTDLLVRLLHESQNR
jgi:LysR family transcriptional regulator, pca operon transcriptional activator